MAPTTSISLVRHGQVHNPRGVFYGRMPRFGLSREGLRQAHSAANVFADRPIEAVFSSPLLRARQTAQAILAAHPGLKLSLSTLLLEIHCPWDGKPAAEVDRRRGDVYSGSGPQYEQPEDVVGRVRRFIARLLRMHAGGHVVAVTHGDVIAFSVLWASRAPVTARNKAGLHKFGLADGYPATGSITTFLYNGASADDPPRLCYLRPLPVTSDR